MRPDTGALVEKVKLQDVLIVLYLFLIFAYVNWFASGPEIPYDSLWKMVKPFQMFSGGEGIKMLIESGWSRSGVQFFMFPVLALTGVSPTALKIIATFIYALTGPVVYLALKKKFDLYTSLATALMFISIHLFGKWRNGDMPWFFLFSAVFLYLFVSWQESGESRFLYYMGLVAGIGTYIKMIILFPFLAFIGGALITEREKLTNMPAREHGIFLSAFLLGASPLLLYSAMEGFVNMNPVHSFVKYPDLFEIVAKRTGQFFKATAPGKPVSSAFDTRSFHIYSLLFGIGASVSLYRKEMMYVTGFVIAFLLTFVTPRLLPVHQMTIVYPFFLTVVAAGIHELKRFKGIHRLAPIAFLLVLLVTAPQYHTRAEHIHPGSITPAEYTRFNSMNFSGPLATNHRHGYAITVLDQDVEGRILAPEHWKYNFFISEKDRMTVDEAVNAYREDKVTLMLLKEGPKGRLFYNSWRYGYNTSKVVDRLEGEERTVLDTSRYEFYVYR